MESSIGPQYFDYSRKFVFVRKPCLSGFVYSVMLPVQPGAQCLLQTYELTSFIQTFYNKARISYSDESLCLILSPSFLIFVL